MTGQTEVVIDASLTDVWRRRVAAAVIDLAIVLAVLCTLTFLQMQRLTRDAAGLLSPADSDRWNALAAMPNRHLAFGDTTYVLAGAELIMTVVMSTLVLLSVYVFIPGYSGTSPGKRLLGLKIVTIDGGVVGVTHAVLRTVVGVVDFLPGIVPWLLGRQLAQRSPWHQRLGDRAARTAVIDARRLLSVSAAEPRAAVLPKAAPTPTRLRESVEPAVVEPAAEPLVRPTTGLFTTVDPSPVAAAPTGRRRAAPPPQHRGASDPADAVPLRHSERTAVAPETRPAEPVGDRSPLAADTGTGADADWLGELGTVLARQRAVTAPDGPCDHRADARAERGPASRQRKVSETGTVAGQAGRPRSPQPEPAVPGDDPVWNDEWQAWLYFDREQGSWQRHDAAARMWVPIG